MVSNRHSSILYPILSVSVVLAYLILVQWYWGWKAIAASWIQIGFTKITLALGLMIVTYLIRGYRVRSYFNGDGELRFSPVLKITLLHNLFNNLLPMRTGEVSFPLLMKRELGLSITQSSAALIWFRLIDLHTIAIIGIVGAMIYFDAVWYWWTLAILLFVFPLIGDIWQRQLRRFFDTRTPERFRPFMVSAFDGFPSSLGNFAKAWSLTLVNWTIKLLMFTWILQLFAPLDFLSALLGSIGGELSSILPIHAPGGLGTYEAGVVAGAAIANPAYEQALLAAINLHLIIIVGTLIGGFVSLLIPSDRRLTEIRQLKK